MNSRNDYGIVHVQWEKRHELVLPADSVSQHALHGSIDKSIDSLDLEAIRDRTLNKLKVGKQSTAGKAIDAFIKELRRK